MRIGPVVLRARDAGRLAGFYERVLGFEVREEEGNGSFEVRSGAGDETLLVLLDDPDAVERPARTPGLYHVAFRVPSREALGDAAARILASEAGITGAADHLVSEAVYGRDPAGNGFEVYADRPRDEWEETPEGVRIETLPLDVRSLTEGADPSKEVIADVGHVHLEVTDLDASEQFYGFLGFERRATGDGVRFLGAEGYHHHVAVNTWSSPDAPLPVRAEGVVGFGVEGADEREDPDGVRVFDPDNQTLY